MEATLSNKDRPEYGSVTVPLPIPPEEYDLWLGLLQKMEIGDPLAQDCRVEALINAPPILDCLPGQQVNVDELDFLARRMEMLLVDDRACFSALVYALDRKDIRSLIDLTFYTDDVTLITDFSPKKLRQEGKAHYLRVRIGASLEELARVDGDSVIRELIASGMGKVTPFGVFYDNGTEFIDLYEGHEFPPEGGAYDSVLDAVFTRPGEEKTEYILPLPAPESFLERMFIRCGLNQEETLHLSLEDSGCPWEALEVTGSELTVTLNDGSVREINDMCRAIAALPGRDQQKLGAVVRFAKAKDTRQIIQLAENLDMFEFVPKVKTPEEYGRYLLRDSEIAADESLSGFFDFERYGKEQVRLYNGAFNERGYVALHASVSVEELMRGDPSGSRAGPTPQDRRAMPRQKEISRGGRER